MHYIINKGKAIQQYYSLLRLFIIKKRSRIWGVSAPFLYFTQWTPKWTPRNFVYFIFSICLIVSNIRDNIKKTKSILCLIIVKNKNNLVKLGEFPLCVISYMDTKVDTAVHASFSINFEILEDRHEMDPRMKLENEVTDRLFIMNMDKRFRLHLISNVIFPKNVWTLHYF